MDVFSGNTFTRDDKGYIKYLLKKSAKGEKAKYIPKEFKIIDGKKVITKP